MNVVTSSMNIPHAVLIRSAKPLEGTHIMLERTKKKKKGSTLTKRQGNVSKDLEITIQHNGISLLGKKIYFIEDGFSIVPPPFFARPWIGVEYAGEDAKRCYHFVLKKYCHNR